MSANEFMLWVVVAVVAFLVGQGRLGAPLAVAGYGAAGAYRGADQMLMAYRRWVLQLMERSFTLDELHTLAFDLGINWDQIGGETIGERGRELIVHCERAGHVAEMLDAMHLFPR